MVIIGPGPHCPHLKFVYVIFFIQVRHGINLNYLIKLISTAKQCATY